VGFQKRTAPRKSRHAVPGLLRANLWSILARFFGKKDCTIVRWINGKQGGGGERKADGVGVFWSDGGGTGGKPSASYLFKERRKGRICPAFISNAGGERGGGEDEEQEVELRSEISKGLEEELGRTTTSVCLGDGKKKYSLLLIDRGRLDCPGGDSLGARLKHSLRLKNFSGRDLELMNTNWRRQEQKDSARHELKFVRQPLGGSADREKRDGKYLLAVGGGGGGADGEGETRETVKTQV